MQNGEIKVWYVHMEIVASLIFENKFQFPLYSHRIRKRKEWENLDEEGLKQECEQTALALILKKIRGYLPKLKITVLLDGLHANQTSMEALDDFHFDFDIVLKKLKSVQEEIDSIDSKVRLVSSKRFELTQTVCFTSDIPYGSRFLNVIEFHEYAEKKPSKRFAKITNKSVHYQWIVSEKIHEVNLFNKVQESRSRWQGEDFFNTIKIRGFNFKHDYSRHPSCQSIWHTLTLIAFALTSILQLCDLGIESRKKATLCAWMKQMLQDLFYLPYETIFLCAYPKQLRFSLWMNAG